MNRLKLLALAALIVLCGGVRAIAQPAPDYFHHTFTRGEHLSNVFSFMYSFRGPGFREQVRRVAGSATYVVTDVHNGRANFTGPYRYDGLASGTNAGYSLDVRTLMPIVKGHVTPDTQASGLALNRFLWGNPPDRLRAGQTWTVTIPTDWEMGPAGVQTVTVVQADPDHATVMLMREGRATAQKSSKSRGTSILINGKQVAVSVTSAGPTHWRGYTTFRSGIIISDDVLSERDVILATRDGRTFRAKERMIMLLNAVPGDT